MSLSRRERSSILLTALRRRRAGRSGSCMLTRASRARVQGTVDNVTVVGDFSHPQPCKEGSYCEWGTGDQAVVTAGAVGAPMLPCPPGNYCPQGTYIPVPVPRGSFAPGTANAQATLCLPGTYTPYEGFQSCLTCPAGYQCPTDGTVTPTICPAGTYRSIRDSITCVNCPMGYWSPLPGLTDAALCTPCNPGLVCAVEGMTNDKPTGSAGVLQARRSRR